MVRQRSEIIVVYLIFIRHDWTYAATCIALRLVPINSKGLAFLSRHAVKVAAHLSVISIVRFKFRVQVRSLRTPLSIQPELRT